MEGWWGDAWGNGGMHGRMRRGEERSRDEKGLTRCQKCHKAQQGEANCHRPMETESTDLPREHPALMSLIDPFRP